MIKLCIFDLDGTLLDTVESIRYNLNEVLTSWGIRSISTDETKVFVGDGAKNLVLRSLKRGGIDIDTDSGREFAEKITEKYNALYDSRPFYLTEPYSGIQDAVRALKAMGMKLAVLSNKPDPTVKQLVKMHFGDTFDIVMGAGELPLKPDPTSALFICRSLLVDPSESAYFGDTATDMRTAKNYGAGVTFGVLWGFRGKEELMESGADVLLERPSDITDKFNN